MASHAVMQLIIIAAKPIASTIRKGRPFVTALGALTGGVLGAINRLVAARYLPFCAILGALIGAFVTAAIFKRPTVKLGARDTDLEPFQPGSVLGYWTFEDGEFKSLAVLLERAVYAVSDSSAPWEKVLQELGRGADPDLPLGELIRLDELAAIETKNRDATGIQVIHLKEGRPKRRRITFLTTGDRDELIAGLERHYARALSWRQRPLDFLRAIHTPLVLTILAGAFFCALAWLSQYWTNNPPPPPRGKREQDELVRFLVWVTPAGWLSVGSIAALAVVVWLVRRIWLPPRILVMEILDSHS